MFDIDPDIARARTPDKRLYTDAGVWAALRERVFARAWHWLGRLDDVAAPGACAPRDLLPGLLDEPLLLARDEAGTLRALANACTHRGMRLVDGPCTLREIRCPYHARRFSLAGRVRAMPGFPGAAATPADSDHLPAAQLHSAFGHGFAALDPWLPFDAWTGAVQHRLDWLDIAAWTHDPTRDRDHSFDAHWALYVENYLEGLHIPFVHPGLNATLAVDGYRYALWPGGAWQIAQTRAGEPAFEPPPGHPEHGQRIAAFYAWLFPNLMLNVYPWGLSVNVVEPLGPARTRVRFRSFVADAALLGQGAGGALDAVEMEDEAVVLGVQRSLPSRLVRGGRYAPVHEIAVHHFHRLLVQALADGSTSQSPRGACAGP
jgi:choline monooxygenase